LSVEKEFLKELLKPVNDSRASQVLDWQNASLPLTQVSEN